MHTSSHVWENMVLFGWPDPVCGDLSVGHGIRRSKWPEAKERTELSQRYDKKRKRFSTEWLVSFEEVDRLFRPEFWQGVLQWGAQELNGKKRIGVRTWTTAPEDEIQRSNSSSSIVVGRTRQDKEERGPVLVRNWWPQGPSEEREREEARRERKETYIEIIDKHIEKMKRFKKDREKREAGMKYFRRREMESIRARTARKREMEAWLERDLRRRVREKKEREEAKQQATEVEDVEMKDAPTSPEVSITLSTEVEILGVPKDPWAFLEKPRRRDWRNQRWSPYFRSSKRPR